MAETKGYIRTTDEKGSVNISQSVVATIAAAAAMDVDGVNGLYQSPTKDYTDASGRKGVLKGSKVTIEDKSVTVDVFLIVDVGYSVSKVAEQAQKSIKSSIEEAIGVKVNAVNVNICGISMKKAKTETTPDTQEKAKNTGNKKK